MFLHVTRFPVSLHQKLSKNKRQQTKAWKQSTASCNSKQQLPPSCLALGKASSSHSWPINPHRCYEWKCLSTDNVCGCQNLHTAMVNAINVSYWQLPKLFTKIPLKKSSATNKRIDSISTQHLNLCFCLSREDSVNKTNQETWKC